MRLRLDEDSIRNSFYGVYERRFRVRAVKFELEGRDAIVIVVILRLFIINGKWCEDCYGIYKLQL